MVHLNFRPSPVSFFFSPILLPDMTRSNTHSHTTEPKTDTTTASGGSSINNTAAVFLAMSQQTQKLFGFMKDEARNLIKNIKDTPNRVISRVQK